eukprot:TRINITY_DN16414_c0_g1_i1.p2 TRINITY_DN16414_c0_g1~~TRINITY_DN16414_c0_g1_i1.p2  ORF type:complete len:130 (-),score=4.50 TRINITY_DN16414_c0_g1_i1:86-475(-)
MRGWRGWRGWKKWKTDYDGSAYRTWGKSGAGVVISGNVMVDSRCMESPANVCVEDNTHMDKLREWATKAQEGGSQLWMQINHAGRQCAASVNSAPFSASATPLTGFPLNILMRTPRAMEEDEISEVIGK